jgi:hypothetical protein
VGGEVKTEILKDLAKGNWSARLRHLISIRIVKFIIVCLVLNLLFLLVLLEDYTSLFFLLGAISGFLIFITLHFLDNRFGKEKTVQDSESLKEFRKDTLQEEDRRKSAVGD